MTLFFFRNLCGPVFVGLEPDGTVSYGLICISRWYHDISMSHRLRFAVFRHQVDEGLLGSSWIWDGVKVLLRVENRSRNILVRRSGVWRCLCVLH